MDDLRTGAPMPGGQAEQDIGLSDLGGWLAARWRFIAGCTAACGLASLAIAFLLTPIYTARTTMLPPGAQQQSGASAALAALGSLGGLAGGAGVRSPDELYVALMRSDSVVRALDQRFGLRDHYQVTHFESLRRMLPNFVRVQADKKSGVITVEVDDPSPVFAAQLANGHAEEISRVLSRLTLSEAQQRRSFFERQLKETKETLIKAETELRGVQEQSGMFALDKQAEGLISAVAQLRALISSRQIQLNVLRTGATDQNSEVMRRMTELRALRTELARLEASGNTSAPGSTELPVGKIPEVSANYVRARREVRLQEVLLEAMVRQYEAAKLDEAKEGPVIQQIDAAQPPDYKAKPSRAFIVIAGTLAGFIVAALYVLARGIGLSSRRLTVAAPPQTS